MADDVSLDIGIAQVTFRDEQGALSEQHVSAEQASAFTILTETGPKFDLRFEVFPRYRPADLTTTRFPELCAAHWAQGGPLR